MAVEANSSVTVLDWARQCFPVWACYCVLFAALYVLLVRLLRYRHMHALNSLSLEENFLQIGSLPCLWRAVDTALRCPLTASVWFFPMIRVRAWRV